MELIRLWGTVAAALTLSAAIVYRLVPTAGLALVALCILWTLLLAMRQNFPRRTTR
ncbi:MAG: hypothetical protein JNM85_06180 [Chthonomonas sp.]|nr:hypothetical protein [Chthonomonas sp.]